MNEAAGGHGVSDNERDALSRLTGQSVGGGDQDRGKPEPMKSDGPAPLEPPRMGPLTAAELSVRRRVVDESGRIVREELPAMFPDRGRQLSRVADEPAKGSGRGGETGLARIGAYAVEVLGAPARRLGPGVVTGLGLAGVILLMALLVAVIIRVLTGA